MARIRYTTLRDDYPEEQTTLNGEVIRKSSQFKSRIYDTIEKLSDELDKLGVAEGIIELDITTKDLKRVQRGEFPRWGEELSPRVRLTFSHPELGPLQYPCGTYSSQKANIRAVVLTLEAQRAIERYGASQAGQQYEGWKGHPPGEEQERYFCDPYDAAEYIAGLCGNTGSSTAILEDPEYFGFCYKKAAKLAHPDAGGSDKAFQTLQQAKELLDAHFSETQQEVA